MSDSRPQVSRLRSPLRWWPLYALGFLAAALYAGDWLLPLSESWRTFLLLPLTGLVCALAIAWGRRAGSLISSEGVDARVEQDPILEALLAQARPIEPVKPREVAPGPAGARGRAPTRVRPATAAVTRTVDPS